MVVSGSWDTTLRIWDTQSGHPIVPPMFGHGSRVTSVAWSPCASGGGGGGSGGGRIASASDDRTVRLWSAPDGLPLAGLAMMHGNVVAAVTFHPAGRFLASGSSDNTARIWLISPPPQGEPAAGAAGAAAGGPAEATGEEVARLAGHCRGVSGVAFSADGGTLATVSWDGNLRLWRPAPPPPRVGGGDAEGPDWGAGVRCVGTGRWCGGGPAMLGAAWDPGGNAVATADRSGTVTLWDLIRAEVPAHARTRTRAHVHHAQA
jgi:WD40 repeat protein